MKTNKFFKGVLAICCGLIVCGSFASCDKDDNDFEVKQDNGDNRELASAEIIYKVSLASQELAVDDVVVTYTDKEGQEHSMTMTDNEWTWKCNLTPADCPRHTDAHLHQCHLHRSRTGLSYQVGHRHRPRTL